MPQVRPVSQMNAVIRVPTVAEVNATVPQVRPMTDVRTVSRVATVMMLCESGDGDGDRVGSDQVSNVHGWGSTKRML